MERRVTAVGQTRPSDGQYNTTMDNNNPCDPATLRTTSMRAACMGTSNTIQKQRATKHRARLPYRTARDCTQRTTRATPQGRSRPARGQSDAIHAATNGGLARVERKRRQLLQPQVQHTSRATSTDKPGTRKKHDKTTRKQQATSTNPAKSGQRNTRAPGLGNQDLIQQDPVRHGSPTRRPICSKQQEA